VSLLSSVNSRRNFR